MSKITDFQKREVIDSHTAKRLGYISDLDVDFETGKINSIIVPKKEGFLSYFIKREEYSIPWGNIVALGSDVILVNTPSLINNPPTKIAEDI